MNNFPIENLSPQATLIVKNFLSLMGLKSFTEWSINRHRKELNDKEVQRADLTDAIEEHERMLKELGHKMADISVATAVLLNPLSRPDVVTLMMYLVKATDTDKEEAYTDVDPESLLKELLDREEETFKKSKKRNCHD